MYLGVDANRATRMRNRGSSTIHESLGCLAVAFRVICGEPRYVSTLDAIIVLRRCQKIALQ